MAKVRITYRDRDGTVSDRVVRSYVIQHMYLHGWCELRQARRTFNMDRILFAVCLETGEILRDELHDIRHRDDHQDQLPAQG